MSTKLTDIHSIEQIICEMTVKEKAQLLTGGSPFATRPMEKYGIPAALLLDGGTGFNAGQYASEVGFQNAVKRALESGNAVDREEFETNGGIYYAQQDMEEHPLKDEEKKTRELGCYPPGMLFGATWNPEAVAACGRALGREMSALGVDCILGTPNVNIHRDPLSGRLFEGYSEDPHLVSALAPAFVKSVQESGAAANVKHFAANNQETNRTGINEHISERALREIYLPGFRSCVEAGCKTVMSAYNRINDVYCAMNPWLLQQVLREEWGFEGFVVSDWGGAVDQAEAIAAGNDVAMPGPRGIDTILNAVENGTLKEEQMDVCIRNFLKILLEMPVMQRRSREADRCESESGAEEQMRVSVLNTEAAAQVPDFDVEEAVRATEFAAREGITLLQNDGTLPLSKDSAVVFCGKRAKAFQGCGAGSAAVDTVLQTNPVDAAAALIGADRVSLHQAKEGTLYWIVVAGANGQEGRDRSTMDMDSDDRQVLEQAIAQAEAAGGKVILVLNTAGPVSLMEYKDRVAAILCAYYPGMQGGKVLADILFGEVNPSGRLPLTWPKYYRDCPTYRNFPGDKVDVWYGEGIYVGYRYYDMKQVEPLYPFGHGLSYTTFEIGQMEVPEEVDVDCGDIPVTVTVKNTGAADGSEVVQLYVRDVVSRFDKPEKELKSFQKVFLKAGEEKRVTFALKKTDLASFSTELGRWVTEPGEYELLAGHSSACIAQRRSVWVSCENPFPLGENTEIGEIAVNREAVALINRILEADIEVLAADPLIYCPEKKWKAVWNEIVTPYLKRRQLSQDVTGRKYEEILEGFRALERRRFSAAEGQR